MNDMQTSLNGIGDLLPFLQRLQRENIEFHLRYFATKNHSRVDSPSRRPCSACVLRRPRRLQLLHGQGGRGFGQESSIRYVGARSVLNFRRWRVLIARGRQRLPELQ